MFKKPQLFILTALSFLGIYLIVSNLFAHSVLDALTVENGVEVMVYCLVKSHILIAILFSGLLFFCLGMFWGEFFMLINQAKQQVSNEINLST